MSDAKAQTEPERPPLIQYWHEEEPPDYIGELLAGFRQRNPDLRHLVFSEATAESFIDRHFGRCELDAFRSCAVPAMQADYFRYCATLALGGVYCDADVRCIAGLRPLLPAPGGGQLFLRPEGSVINGLFAFGSPGHAFVELALEIATVNIERRLCDRVYFTTGPPIFTSLYWWDRLGSFEAFVERAAAQWPEDYLRAYCRVVGDCSRASHACKGVRVSPVGESESFIQGPRESLPYKSAGRHWTDARGTIFRSASSAGPG